MTRTVLLSSDAIANVYKHNVENLAMANKKPKRLVYNSLSSLLQESCLLGATRYGQNFIA